MAGGPIDTMRDALFGSPPSNVYEPSRTGTLNAFIQLQEEIDALGLNASVSVVKITAADLAADLDHDANTIALVVNDATDANNGIYYKVGASGSGSWTKSNLGFPDVLTGDLEALRDEAMVFAGEASDSADAADIDAASAHADRLAVLAALSVASVAAFYDTKALATAALGSIANLAVIEVLADESLAGGPAIYRKESGALVLKANLDILRTDLAGDNGAADIGYKRPGTGAIKITIADFLNFQEVIPEQFGALGDGATNDTVAFDKAVAYLKTLPRGGTIKLGRKTYIGTVDASLFGSSFDKALVIKGQGWNSSFIRGNVNGKPVVDCIGSNNITLETFNIGDDGTHVPSCGVLLARATTTSENCNGSRLTFMTVEGSFDTAALVSIAAESSVLVGSTFKNSNATAKWKALYTSNYNDIGITSAHGTLLASSNTSNRALACTFYSAYTGSGSELLHFHAAASWVFTACEMITGGNTGGMIAKYTIHAGEGIFAGAVVFDECLTEGNDPILHNLIGETGVACFFKGIKHKGGYANQYASTVQEIVKCNSGGGTLCYMQEGEITRPRFNPGTTPRVVVDGIQANPIDIFTPQAVTTITVNVFQANMPAMRADVINEAQSQPGYRGVSYGTAAPVTGTYARGHMVYPQPVDPFDDTDPTNIAVTYYGLMGWLCIDYPLTFVEIHRQPIGSGSTGSRPGGSPVAGLMFMDTTLNKPVWSTGSGTWRDAAGSIV